MEKVHKKNGFTLVEILVVILVIGLLFLFFIPKIDFASSKAKETGVKSDFRTYMLAAEQLMRENSGLAKNNTLALAASGMNLYLDPQAQFYGVDDKDVDQNTAKVGAIAGESVSKDPWNKPFKLSVSALAGNNGTITVTCGGKDGDVSTAVDNYTVSTAFTDGQIKSTTTGFSSNIE